MRKQLVLFTRSYPFGKEETFLETEINYLSKSFEEILIVPLERRDGLRDVPENVKVLTPMFSGKKIGEILLKSFHVLLAPKLLLKLHSRGSFFKKLKQLIICAYLHSYLKRWGIGSSSSAVWYFYWGVHQVSYLTLFPVQNVSVARFHRYDLYETANAPIPFRKELLEKLDYVVCISKHGADFIKNKYPEFSQKVSIHKLGTEDFGTTLEEQGPPFNIVSCSNVISVKRVTLIAEALRFLKIKVKWIHFGDGELMEQLRSLAKDLPSNIAVELKGRVSNIEVLNFYRSNPIHLFLNVSSSEGIPVSIMEAISFSIPVLATNVDGNGEIVNNDLGALVDLNVSPSELALNIEKILLNPNYRVLKKQARKMWAEEYSAQRNYQSFCEFLGSI